MYQRAATCLWAASKEPSRGQSLCSPLARAVWLVWTCGRNFDTFLFLKSECGSKGREKVRQEIWLPLRCFDNLLHKKQKPSGFSHCNVEHGLLETYSYSSVTRSEMLYLPQGTRERRAAPSALLEAMPAVQIIFFQNFMIWCLDYICLAVEVWGLKNLSEERIAPAPDMCAFGVQLQPGRWKSLRRDEVTWCLVWDSKCRRGETHLVAEVGEVAVSQLGWIQNQVKPPKAHLDISHCAVDMFHPSQTSWGAEGLDINHHCLSHLHCFEKKDLHFQI